MRHPRDSVQPGGVSEIVIHEQTGFLVSSADEMAEAIGRVGQIDPMECRQHVENQFSSKAMARGYMELYEKLV